LKTFTVEVSYDTKQGRRHTATYRKTRAETGDEAIARTFDALRSCTRPMADEPNLIATATMNPETN
jgi:hypothetical protein